MIERVYFVPPAIITPVELTAAATVCGLALTPWWLASIPFIWLGSICGQPNLNMADGCLAWLTIVVGLFLFAAVPPLATSIVFGTLSGLVASAMEKAARARPASDGSFAPPPSW